MSSPVSVLQQYWGYNAFRPVQEDIIQAILDGHDTLALLPTGGGKSICFQVPAMMMDGLCLVITPLIALMRDQVDNLRQRGIPARAIYAGMYYQEVEKALENARRGAYKFLYVSPERLQSKLFKQYCDGLPVSLIAVDEAHCISQWGYDFRPAYLQIATIRPLFPQAKILALTASATPEVQKDIREKLQLENACTFYKSFARPNLSYSVLPEVAKPAKILHVLQRVPGCAIIYCRNRKRTREIAEQLQTQGIAANYYHAGLPAEERTIRQEDWIKDRVRVMVCTNAFGMGIDKPDVKLVIHYDAPDSPEAYYQEAGRAGRDEAKAYAVLLYHQQELEDMLEKIPLQFPSLPEIKEVYQCIVNYLQVPVGETDGTYYSFDINSFVKTFQLNITMAYSAIRILSQEGVLQLSESVFLPSRAEVITGREGLHVLEEKQPRLDRLFKSLLRTYEGIYDTMVPVYEKQLARILYRTEEEIIQGLEQLHQIGMIAYHPRREEPQLSFLQERVPARHLQVDMEHVAARRAAYTTRVKAMISYIEDHTTCRTRQLVTYFGQQEKEDCGICDVCVKRKATGITRESFEIVSAQVTTILQQQEMPLQELLRRIPEIEEAHLLEILQFLITEEKIYRNKDGILSGMTKRS